MDTKHHNKLPDDFPKVLYAACSYKHLMNILDNKLLIGHRLPERVEGVGEQNSPLLLISKYPLYYAKKFMRAGTSSCLVAISAKTLRGSFFSFDPTSMEKATRGFDGVEDSDSRNFTLGGHRLQFYKDQTKHNRGWEPAQLTLGNSGLCQYHGAIALSSLKHVYIVNWSVGASPMLVTSLSTLAMRCKPSDPPAVGTGETPEEYHRALSAAFLHGRFTRLSEMLNVQDNLSAMPWLKQLSADAVSSCSVPELIRTVNKTRIGHP